MSSAIRARTRRRSSTRCWISTPKSGRTATTSAQALLDHVRAHGLQVQWLLETHAHADHLSAAHWLKSQHFPSATLAIGEGIRDVQKPLPPGLQPWRALAGRRFAVRPPVRRRRPFRDRLACSAGDRGARPHQRQQCLPDRRRAVHRRLAVHARRRHRALRLPRWRRSHAVSLDPALVRTLPDDTRVFVCHDYGPGGREVACETTIGEEKRGNIHLRDGVDEAEFVALREARDATLAMPALILPAVQVNIRAGALPDAGGQRRALSQVPDRPALRRT